MQKVPSPIPCHLQVGLWKIPHLKSWGVMPISMDNTKPDGPMLWLAITPFPIFLSSRGNTSHCTTSYQMLPKIFPIQVNNCSVLHTLKTMAAWHSLDEVCPASSASWICILFNMNTLVTRPFPSPDVASTSHSSSWLLQQLIVTPWTLSYCVSFTFQATSQPPPLEQHVKRVTASFPDSIVNVLLSNTAALQRLILDQLFLK